MATRHFFSPTTFTFTSNKLSEFFPCSVFPQPKVSYQTRLGCRLQISRLNYKITDSQRHLPVVSCAVLCWGQTGGSVGSEVHLLSEVEEADVIVVTAIILVNNQLLHFDDQLWQRSLALLFSVILSKCDLSIENIQPHYIEKVAIFFVMHTVMLLTSANDLWSPCTQWAAVMMNLDAMSVPPQRTLLNFPFFIFLM